MVYVAPEVDSDDENVEYEDESGHRYRLYLDELEGGGSPGAGCKESGGEMKGLPGKRPPLYSDRADCQGHVKASRDTALTVPTKGRDSHSGSLLCTPIDMFSTSSCLRHLRRFQLSRL